MMLLPICGLFGPAAAAQESQTGKNPSFRILAMPVVILFVFLQKYIVGGLTAGAVKE